MAIISLAQWAKKHGMTDANARQKAARGQLPAYKISNMWVIEESTPNVDHRKDGLSKRWKKDE